MELGVANRVVMPGSNTSAGVHARSTFLMQHRSRRVSTSLHRERLGPGRGCRSTASVAGKVNVRGVNKVDVWLRRHPLLIEYGLLVSSSEAPVYVFAGRVLKLFLSQIIRYPRTNRPSVWRPTTYRKLQKCSHEVGPDAVSTWAIR